MHCIPSTVSNGLVCYLMFQKLFVWGAYKYFFMINRVSQTNVLS